METGQFPVNCLLKSTQSKRGTADAVLFDMKTKASNRPIQGMTLLEAVVVIVMLVILLAMLLPALSRAGSRPHISCINNLKQIGTAYRVWENDNGNLYPMGQVETNGGMRELLAGSARAGQFAYLPYAIMQNEMGQSPKVVVCPNDASHSQYQFLFWRTKCAAWNPLHQHRHLRQY